MASWFSYFGGRRDPKQSARDAIVTLREQLHMIEKKEEYLQRKIDEELKRAKANSTSNKATATAALRRKKMHESELDKLSGTRLQLETQINTLESANINQETMQAMKKGADALKTIHRGMNMDTVDATMNEINTQRELANEISEAISNPAFAGVEIDEDELKKELDELEQEDLNERLMGADHVPVHTPAGATKVAETPARSQEEDDEAELKELQAALAM